MKVRVVGGGYAGVRAALDLDRRLRRRPGVAVTLIDKQPYHQLITEAYRPAAGGAGPKALRIPLDDIFAGTKVQVVQGTVTDLRLNQRRLILDGRTALGYDWLIVAPGSQPEFFSIPGVEEHALTIHGVNSAAFVWHHIEAQFNTARTLDQDDGQRQAYTTIVVIGGGFTGVEFAGELADHLPPLTRRCGLAPGDARIVCIEAASDILPGFADPLVDAAVETLLTKGVSLELGVPIVAVEPDRVRLQDGRDVGARTILWTGGVRASSFIEANFTTGLRGRAVVDEHLRSVDSPAVYVAGDAALATDPASGRPVPPTAQHAIEQGRLAARNVWADIVGLRPEAFRSRDFSIIATVGRDVGVANVGGVKMAGRFPAVLKDASTLRYVYSLGGTRLLLAFMARHWSALLTR